MPTSNMIPATSPLDWKDISDEQWRSYIFPNGIVRVPYPKLLNVKTKHNGDSHRIITETESYYIPAGWLAIMWLPQEGKPPYAF